MRLKSWIVRLCLIRRVSKRTIGVSALSEPDSVSPAGTKGKTKALTKKLRKKAFTQRLLHKSDCIKVLNESACTDEAILRDND